MNSGMASLRASPESMRYTAERLGILLQLYSSVVCTSTKYANLPAENNVNTIQFSGRVQKN